MVVNTTTSNDLAGLLHVSGGIVYLDVATLEVASCVKGLIIFHSVSVYFIRAKKFRDRSYLSIRVKAIEKTYLDAQVLAHPPPPRALAYPTAHHYSHEQHMRLERPRKLLEEL